MKLSPLVCVLGAMAGCAVGPDYREPREPMPDQFSNGAQPGIGTGQVVAQFWTLLNDPELNRLVDDALAANKDLARAAGNLQASRAAARLTGFDAYPTITAGGSYSHSLASTHAYSGFPGVSRSQRTIDTYDAGFDAFWELDFFGAVRRSKEASRADAAAAEATLRDAIVSVTAEVARNYCVLRGLQNQLA
ncbi:MAG: TolC family protein, partial [Steroidobacteraceae bacterium]